MAKAVALDMERLYESEVRSELARLAGHPAAPPFRFTGENTAALPEPVRRHLQVCGWMGKPVPRNARIIWGDFELKRSREASWMPLECRQFNAVDEPARIAYMGGRLMKGVPLEGRDKYQDGHGHMLIKAMKLFKVVDERSRKMDESALVTVLAEAFLVPSYVVQPYIRWESLSPDAAKAILEWNGLRVEGAFHFAPTGEFTRFETNSRWQHSQDPVPVPWTAHMEDYVTQAGLRLGTRLKAVWHEKSGDFEYARGRIARIDFDVSDVGDARSVRGT
jgi:hypothetical protein